ncbi:bifunctional 4-hydroxy-2-oxoglutarate aldolase/2-dehydro-3-deoxy-phosphogluconate aldolase [Bacillus sp. FJAT-28004]|uniref:bifunctional 4-hydroxy-2-oxoglutarate aldolase/2-dehydro-3-deoxy-phosphogluconate aldolase n=1 Tax=Bacillus sp. FJAT-28004 TaxID=1679165 RepID=UPI0006B5AE88|nr:bifunctional 4-hydroxy-2-oxoglutarate aldolase/2-dehydro-3-deoxy-phosphogluconate aldolase [Bacillus sp. FJAT-28004]
MSLTEQLFKHKIVAIVRGIAEDQADAATDALYRGGVRFIEVTMNTKGATGMIQRWRSKYDGKMFVGAGTVLDEKLAQEAVKAGAQFLITPNVDEAVIRYGIQAGVDLYPGAMTATEIVQAWTYGAHVVKVFPAGSLGSTYIKELQGPLSHIPMMATGGVNLDNMKEYAAAGSRAFGLGGNLVSSALIQSGDFAGLEQHARRYVEAAMLL